MKHGVVMLIVLVTLHKDIKDVLSVLWHCWLGARKGIQSVKTEWWDIGVVVCLERGAYGLYMVQLMQLPPHHLLLQ